MKIQRIIRKNRKLFQKDIKTVDSRRREWDAFSKRATIFFNNVISEFEKDQFFDKLYIDEGKFPFIERKNQNTIGLRFGSHPTGISITQYSTDDEISSRNADIEKGGSLLYSQAPNGQVACLIYACESEFIKAKNKYFIFKRYKNPKHIDESELAKGTKVFFWYSRISSFVTNFSIRDTCKLDFFKIRSFTSKPDWNAVFGVIGAIAALFYIISFLV